MPQLPQVKADRWLEWAGPPFLQCAYLPFQGFTIVSAPHQQSMHASHICTDSASKCSLAWPVMTEDTGPCSPCLNAAQESI